MVAPGDLAGYEEFAQFAADVYREGYLKLGTVPFLSFSAMLKAALLVALLFFEASWQATDQAVAARC